MTEYIEKINWMKPIIPAHTSHNYEVFWLEIMLNNKAFILIVFKLWTRMRLID